MNDSILAAISGALQGGYKSNQDFQDREFEEAQKRAQLKLQQDTLARAIAQDQATNAHQRVMEDQGAAQQKSLEDQRLFTQSEAMVNRGFKGPITGDQLAKLHPTTQALAFNEVKRPEAGGMMALDGSQSQELAPQAQDWTQIYEQKQGETERMKIAELNSQRQIAQAMGQQQNAALDRQSRENIANARIMAGAAAAAAKANNPKPRNLPLGGANDLIDLDTSLDDVGALRTALGGEGGTAASTGFMANVQANWTPNFITEAFGVGGDAKARQGVIDRVKQVIGKTLEGGVLRKEDEIKYEKILPTIWDPPNVATQKLNGLEAALLRRRGRTLSGYEDAGMDVSRYPTTYVPSQGQHQAAHQSSPTMNQAIAGVSGGFSPMPGAGASLADRFKLRNSGTR